MSQYTKPKTISQAYRNPRYQGKIVVQSPDGLYSTTQSETAVKKFRQLKKKYPRHHVITTVIPKGVLLPAQAEVTQ